MAVSVAAAAVPEQGPVTGEVEIPPPLHVVEPEPPRPADDGACAAACSASLSHRSLLAMTA